MKLCIWKLVNNPSSNSFSFRELATDNTFLPSGNLNGPHYKHHFRFRLTPLKFSCTCQQLILRRNSQQWFAYWDEALVCGLHQMQLLFLLFFRPNTSTTRTIPASQTAHIKEGFGGSRRGRTPRGFKRKLGARIWA